MTARERTLLITGLAGGIILGGISFWMLAARPGKEAAPAAPPAASTAPAEHSAREAAPAAGDEIELSPHEQEAVGLKTYVVSTRTVGEELRTVGREIGRAHV